LRAAQRPGRRSCLELQQILPAGQAVDFVSFTIGGNDVRFSEVIGQLIGEPDGPLSILDGERTHDRIQRQLVDLRETMARVGGLFRIRIRRPALRGDRPLGTG
jgi:hypothetical protein